MEPTTIAIDLATRVFQVHFVDPETGAIHSKVLKRAQLVPFFANRTRSRVVMEACGSAHHWARQLAKLGHDVRLTPRERARSLGRADQEAQTAERGNRGAGKQDGADDLGNPRPRSTVPEGSCEREDNLNGLAPRRRSAFLHRMARRKSCVGNRM